MSSSSVPVDTTTIKTLYVFVEISVDRAHLAASIRLNFPSCIPSPIYKGSEKGKGPALEIQLGDEAATTPPSSASDSRMPGDDQVKTKLAVVGTIQFVAAVQGLKDDLEAYLPEDQSQPERLAIEGGPSADMDIQPPSSQSQAPHKTRKPVFEVSVPQVKPLSPGEILGCTAPRLAPDTDALMCVVSSRPSASLSQC